MHRLAPVVVLLASTTSARAGVQTFFSASFGVGQAHRNGVDDGFASSLRPELMFAADVDRPLVGVGPYLQLAVIAAPSATSDHETLLGGGVTAVLYSRAGLAVAGSLGLETGSLGAGWHRQLAVSLFAGFRDSELGQIDMPFGVRLEARPGTDALPATAVASLSLDLVTIGAGIYALNELISRHH